jgi:release factor glutamine methyltransferase
LALTVTGEFDDISIAEALRQASQVLRQSGVPEARREAGSLLAHVSGKNRTFLISHAEALLTAEEVEQYRQAVERRAAGEPLQYITGTQDFYGLEFMVTRDVLIPRPETELLVESALNLIGGHTVAPEICDVGTGSGCIAITLVHELPQARARALDISEAALRIAQRNAERHNVAKRITFRQSDCFESLPANTVFDLIASNPPYVSGPALAGLQREVRDHEPVVALSPGLDGLLVIRRLLSDAPAFLKPQGYLVLEIGFDQGEAVSRLVVEQTWNLLDIRPDLQGIPRIVLLQYTGSAGGLPAT